ncbi:indolepyruvate ferredoxin oxidoreductase subunit alpha [Clostridium sp. 'deep sea']|uniref:indolepyruvate ferredoxin oxidoreductase subunit alpha n=1 Tax=Clostridium sp. 'deep sea' TaxID=2779445 RepID=UPI00189659FB|nr:indolepyruvate ferredoxin oxidoreductase subunit alpha [Clostridium sp. 'deep sea']QOR36489.1 indolepyruvate ferredoxin oxidoreductase subunit alpha [Clostridium sp. 'deep sea']
MKKLMTGNEAVARGAYEAGVRYAAAYPGTPSTEILENILNYKNDIYAEWAPNEKVALESAIGAAFAGARSIASMKHVGVNVAADPLFTLSYIGVNGGFVLVSADEPGMHSSQNEQDNRNYAKFAKIPMFEPATSQEAKEMIKEAYKVSEQYDTPVLYRLTTRLCHSKGIVDCNDRVEVPIVKYEKNASKTVSVPANSRKMRYKVEERMIKLKDYSNNSPLNFSEINDTKIGIVASGVSYHYAYEVFGAEASYFKIGFSNPLPIEKIREFANQVDKLYIVEENDPYIEEQLKINGIECIGKDIFPFTGEMTPDVIRKAFYGEQLKTAEFTADEVVARPPTLCAGCPHRGFFYELAKKRNVFISGDIGCYTLAFAPPYNAMDAVVCMGGSLSMGHGAQKVFNMNKDNDMRVVSVLGDSTFFHTGINSLLNVAYNQSNTVNVILDNRITGMTGHQQNPGTGYTAGGQSAPNLDLEVLVKACGIKHVKTIDPNNLKKVKETLNWAFALDQPCVIITRWPCVLKKFSQEDKDEFTNAFREKCTIDHDKCIGCRQCIKTGCPALSFNKETRKASIDYNSCVGCEVCLQTCPVNAISKEQR